MSADARRALDSMLAHHREHLTPAPPRGWVRAVRDALGMTAEQLAGRMGVSRQAVTQMERSEAEGTVSLSTLRRAAEALGCRIEYVLVPDEPLEDRVRQRARRVARDMLEEVEHTMALEDEQVDLDHRVEELAAELIDRGGLWQP